MALAKEYVGRRACVLVSEGKYEGFIDSIDLLHRRITLRGVLIPSTGEKLKGLQDFYSSEIKAMDIFNSIEDDASQENELEKVIFKTKRDPSVLATKWKPKHQYTERKCVLLKDLHLKNDGSKCIVPAIKKTDNYTVLDQIDDEFFKALNKIEKQNVIGFGVQGIDIGRTGKLCLLQIAIKNHVYVFDIINLAEECFKLGIKDILENEQILKVIHDCRLLSDILHHQYNIQLVNVFDVQVANAFVYRLNHNNQWPSYVQGLPSSLYQHLQLSEEEVASVKVRENLKEEDEKVWACRPISQPLLDIAMKNVKHLLQLRGILADKMMAEYIAGVDVYLSCVRDSSDAEASKSQTKQSKIPVQFENISKYVKLTRHRFTKEMNRQRQQSRDEDIAEEWNRTPSSVWYQRCKGDIKKVVIPLTSGAEQKQTGEDVAISKTHDLSSKRTDEHPVMSDVAETLPGSILSSKKMTNFDEDFNYLPAGTEIQPKRNFVTKNRKPLFVEANSSREENFPGGDRNLHGITSKSTSETICSTVTNTKGRLPLKRFKLESMGRAAGLRRSSERCCENLDVIPTPKSTSSLDGDSLCEILSSAGIHCLPAASIRESSCHPCPPPKMYSTVSGNIKGLDSAEDGKQAGC